MQKKQKNSFNKNIDADEITMFLSGVKILQNMDENVIYEIAKKMRCQAFTPSSHLIKKGQHGVRMFVIWSGKVIVQLDTCADSLAKEITLGRGGVIGEISLLSNKKYSANVVAITNVLALTLERDSFHQLICKHTTFADALSKLMSVRLAQNDGVQEVGKYKLLGKIGEGGMAMVYNAYDPDLEREVAVKMLKYHIAADHEFLEYFHQEAKTIAALKHPNIVNVLEIIDAYSTRFIIMEKVEGLNLHQHLKRYGAFPPNEARTILSDLAKALEYAHNHGEKGIVHRDIKPSNVIIDRSGHVKLMDFGIAGPPSKQSIIEGSPYCMSPEMILGKPVDGHADIYALGIMAFQMLVGKPPFSGDSLDEILHKHVSETPPRIQKYVADIPTGLANFINGALIKDTSKRLSDWSKIHFLLHQEDTITLTDQQSLCANEQGLFIRMKNASESDIDNMKTLLQSVFTQRKIDFSLHTILPKTKRPRHD